IQFSTNILRKIDWNKNSIWQSSVDRSSRGVSEKIIINCWQPIPSQRSKLSSARSVIQRAMKDMKITDLLLAMNQRLEYFTNHLNAAVEVRAKQAEMGHQRIMNVLDALFPGGVAEKLLAGERPPPIEYKQCCVYLNDIVGYTKICNQNTIETVVEFLDTLFLTYDSIIENYDIHPITRIGDAYLVRGAKTIRFERSELVSGVPYEKDGKFHAKEIGQAALQIVTAVQQLNFPYIKGCKNLQIRTGIASGVAVAGVLGIEAPSFNIIGPAVEMASALEGASAPFKILVNKEARDLMLGDFTFELTPKEVPFYDETIVAYWLTENAPMEQKKEEYACLDSCQARKQLTIVTPGLTLAITKQ
uniref:Guanylate cyclase domain-containing protein n=1 Tax=Romanomermis culicivorax TaxID=13658 RepID=A0A915KJJ6_ROMCU